MTVIRPSTNSPRFRYPFNNKGIRPDPNGILAFAVQELQAAEDAGQRAWIIAHMTPGRRDTLSDQVRSP